MEQRGVLRAPDGGSGIGGDLPTLAVRRLVLVSTLAVAVAAVSMVVALLRQPNVGVRAGTSRPQELIYFGFALSVAMVFAFRGKWLSAARKLDLGLVYLIFLCLLAGVYRHWLPYADSDVVRGISPAGLAILFFAVVVPVAPTRMAVAGTIAALADVLALVLTVTPVGNPAPPWNLWVWLLLPNVVVVVFAVLTSRFIYELGESVRRAREMGAYKLVEKLGSGGMGEVWKADHRTLARPAAIKLMRPELLGAIESADTQRLLARFEREARATAALTSPHTIAVYDFGRAEDGAFYYVMELLEGMDLESLVQLHGRVPPERAVHLLLQVCHSLREAHREGVVHRDIKPANIYVCRQGDERDFVKVLDFGLVKVEAEADSADAKLTDVGAVLGTPAYMAPEIATGLDATPRSDIYAIGCLLYWLLTGRMVFEGKPHPMQQVLAHMQEIPEPPSRHAPVPTHLDTLVLDCLAKEPEARPQTVAELEARLRATELSEPWTQVQAEQWWASVDPSARVDDVAMSPTLPAAALVGD